MRNTGSRTLQVFSAELWSCQRSDLSFGESFDRKKSYLRLLPQPHTINLLIPDDRLGCHIHTLCLPQNMCGLPLLGLKLICKHLLDVRCKIYPNWDHFRISPKWLVLLCSVAWSQYTLDNQFKWLPEGTLDFNILHDFEIFCWHMSK